MTAANERDIIVFGASLTGVAASIRLKRLGYNPLLCNLYGFPGGTITEALNLLQIKNLTNEGSVTNKLIELLNEEKHSFLYRNDSEVVINPESLKNILLRSLKENQIDLLFHVRPLELKYRNSKPILSLIAKEGIIEVAADRIIDTSGDSAILGILDNNYFSNASWCLNLITSPGDASNIKDIAEPGSYRTLFDRRHWISISMDVENPLRAEIVAQGHINRITDRLNERGMRIQLLPARSMPHYPDIREFKKYDFIDLPEQHINASYRREEELIRSEEFENYIVNRF
jgi:hypothetical protein